MRGSVLLLLALAACPKDVPEGKQCSDGVATSDFKLPAAATLPDGSANVTQKLTKMSADECGDSDNAALAPVVWRSKCEQFLKTIQSEHCLPLIDSRCESGCTTEGAKAACKEAADRRGPSTDACMKGSLEGLRAAAPFCRGLELDGANPTIFAAPAGPRPACP